MRLLFLGTCIFKNNFNVEICNPFENIKEYLSFADVIFINMIGGISQEEDSNKLISNGNQLLSLKKLVPHIPIIVTFKDDIITKYGIKYIKHTERFLTQNGFIFCPKMYHPLLYGNLCVFNFIDIDLVNNINIMDNIIPIIISPSNTIILSLIKCFRKPLRRIIILIKKKINTSRFLFEKLAEKLIDSGAEIVLGYGNDNMAVDKFTIYKHGIIIFDLGYFINCNMNHANRYDNKTELCLFNTILKSTYLLDLKRYIVDDCLVSTKLRS